MPNPPTVHILKDSSLSPNEKEVLRWKEPTLSSPSQALPPSSIMLISQVTAILLLLFGYWQKDYTLYVAAPVASLAGLALRAQRHTPHREATIILTTERLIVADKSFFLCDLAGFWIETEEDHLVINIESKKPSLVPMSLLYPLVNSKELAQQLLSVLAEVEPREPQFADRLSRYLHL